MYDTFICGCCLEIAAAYDIAPWALGLIWRYWDRLLMVSRSGRYFGRKFQGQRGVTQEDPLSTIIFNMVVYAVLRHWVSVVEYLELESDSEGFVRDFQRMLEYLYDNNSLIDSTRVTRLQR